METWSRGSKPGIKEHKDIFLGNSIFNIIGNISFNITNGTLLLQLIKVRRFHLTGLNLMELLNLTKVI